VGEIERNMSAREMGDWRRFCFHRPLPFELTDIHGAMLLALLANINRPKDHPSFDPVDMMILRAKPTRAAPTLTIAQRMKRATEE